MAIYQRQYTKILAQEMLKYMMLGKLPDANYIASKVLDLLKNSNITYTYTPQPYKDIFQNKVYNKALTRIKFDIDTLHEELIDLVLKASEKITYADLYHKVNSHQLSKLQAELESILFSIQDADFYFLGAFETFSDVTKCDQDESTKSIVDLSECAIMLPYGGKNTQKIKTSHLYDSASWPVNVTANSLISSSITPGSKFGNIFSDMTSAWGYEVITSEQEKVDITFRFPVGGSPEQEVELLINRIEVIPHSPSLQRFNIKVSNDNINYMSILGYEDGIDIVDQKITYALDFETNLVQYIEVTLSKSTPDIEQVINNTKQFKYYFGLRNISLLSVGRTSFARYQSKPFDFTNNEDKISKVSIQTNAIKPKGCSINYSVALSNNQNEVVTSFIPITPLNEKSNTDTGVSTVVNFNSTLDSTARIIANFSGDDSPQEYGRAFQGKRFYRIGNSINPKPSFGTSELYRGFKSWYRDSSNGFELSSISDIYISFEESDIESIYTWVKESPQVSTLPSSDGIRKIQLQLNKPVYYSSSRGHLMKPPAGVTNTQTDIKPNYAISKVLLTGPSSRITKEFLLQSSRTQDLPATNFIVQSVNDSDMPVLQTGTGQIYRRNIDYVILTEDINGKQVPSGKFNIPDGSALLNASGNVATPLLIMEFVYTNDPDITYKVTNIQDNFVTISNIVSSYSDNIEITYRYVPVDPSEIIKPSIRVSNLPTTSSNRTYYVEGKDYTVSIDDGGIQRIPTGSIGDKSSVYVEYTFRDSTSGIQTFTTWCHITDSSGISIKFEPSDNNKTNKLIPDLDAGEAFYVNGPQGVIDITKALNTTVLGPGWIQFIVRSKNPDINNAFGSNLINQVIQLRDSNNKKIFRDNNFYFKEITAIRDPLKEITLNHLKVNTLLNDHNSFAIDNTTSPTDSYIVLNFKPNETNELYSYTPTEDSDILNNPSVTAEEFLFIWRSKLVTNLIGNKVVVRIDLSREQNIDGALTPKVFDYKLRAGI